MADGDQIEASLKNHKHKRPISKDYNLKKRQPQKPERADNIVYVSTKTNTKAYLDKCTKLINEGENEIVIYCIGAAIQRGILLALQVCEAHPTFEISCNTLSTELTDDLEPAADDVDYEIQKRFNSSLRITVLRVNPLEKN